jgi:DNA-binding beta-propeller fold protein YncE
MSSDLQPARRLVGMPPLGISALFGIVAGLVIYIMLAGSERATGSALAVQNTSAEFEAPREPVAAPELDGGVAWLNTAGPIKLKDLRGKIVLLDFWTLCCINCIHTLPDLARLEKKYANELVVIGVHSAKFDNEKSTASIRKAILRYEVHHPVVNDAQMRIWRDFHVQSWPTLVLIDPEGNLVGYASGEGNYDVLDRVIARLIEQHKAKKTLDDKPRRFELAHEEGASPLFFPGKVLADAASGRLFIADSTHHRIVITDLNGKKIAIAGAGEAGRVDGPFAQAKFNDPQGMALDGNRLYVADRKNHLVRVLHLKENTVSTLAGTGMQGQDREHGGKALATGLNSPWDLLLHDGKLFIAMAGAHQIWLLDLASSEVGPYAGDGRENIGDGPLSSARFAQPSGLASDGTTLYVADSEVSAVRAVPFAPDDSVRTLVGEGLFEFGDVDGPGAKARLQHALGVVWAEGKIYIADTYNSKIKTLDPKTRSCTTFLGGESAGWLAPQLFNEPGGISYAAGKLYLADTNAHRIRVVDLKTKTVSTLALQGVEAPKPAGPGTGS